MSFAPTGTLREQVARIRRSVGVSLLDDLTLLQLPADAGVRALDSRVATNLGIREAQCRQGLCLDAGGRPIADLLLGFFRGTLHVLGTGLEHEALIDALGAHEATRAYEDHVVIGVDGPFAWEVIGAWDSPSAIGLPYLGLYSPREGLLVIRAGRTGEYGYWILTPRDQLDEVWQALVAQAEAIEGGVVGREALAHCALENWVFEIEREGRHGLDALELQLTWRLDLQKQATGLDAIREYRTSGLRRRLTAVRSDTPLADGAVIHSTDRPIGSVLASAPRLFREGTSALAVLDLEWAHPGASYAVGDQPVHTISAPFLLNRSLFVNPQRHGWANRDEVELPPEVLWPNTTSW